jgi:hypothetical protein
MIFYRTLLDELRRDDAFCECCGLGLRRALVRAAERRDPTFLRCQICRRTWSPSDKASIDEAARGWVLIFVTGNSIPAAMLCGDCAASHPEPACLPPSIARLVLSQIRGGMPQ